MCLWIQLQCICEKAEYKLVCRINWYKRATFFFRNLEQKFNTPDHEIWIDCLKHERYYLLIVFNMMILFPKLIFSALGVPGGKVIFLSTYSLDSKPASQRQNKSSVLNFKEPKDVGKVIVLGKFAIKTTAGNCGNMTSIWIKLEKYFSAWKLISTNL